MKNKKILFIGIPVILITIGLILFFILSGKKTYVVTFDSNGGSVVESQKVKEGDNIKEPAKPTREDYIFVEWTKSGQTYNFNTVIDSDITLVAKWKKAVPNEYEIIIDYKNGEENSIVKVLENEKLEKPEDPKYEGYTFKGWTVNEEPYDFDSEVSSSFTLVALWDKEKNKYTVTFDSNGGSKVSEQKIEEGELVTKPENPTKKDNTFVEWQLNGKTYDFETEVTKNITLKAKWKSVNEYELYKNDAFILRCYEKGTVNTPSIVKPGDQIECDIDFEVYASDAISSLEYEVKYGQGLKLIDTKGITKVSNNNYKNTYSKPTSVGNAGKFYFEVLNVDDLTDSPNYTVTIDKIRFITSENKRYYVEKISTKHMSIWERMNSAYIYNNGGFTLKCVDKNNQPISKVVNGDVIICDASIEVSSGDEIKYLKYTFGFGSSLELIKTEIDDEIVNVGRYHYIANNPIKKLNLGRKTFKVVNENNPHMLFVDIYGQYSTVDGRYLSLNEQQVKFENGNSITKNSFKKIALNLINKAREDLVSANKLQEGFYYITKGDTAKSPLGGSIKYYTSSCTKVGSMLCIRKENSECNRSSRSFIKVSNNDGKYEYSICLTAGYDYAYIYGKEADLMDNNNFSMINFPD